MVLDDNLCDCALHVALILFVPWKSGWVPARFTTLFCIVDLAMIFGVVALVQKMMKADVREDSKPALKP